MSDYVKYNKGELKDDFYQSKFNYYKQTCIFTVIFSVIANSLYWISDCQLFGRVAFETLIPRLFMFLPLIVYLIFSRRVLNYKIMILLSYLMIHGIMWCTIWAIYYLPIKQHANEGFIIMHLMFMALGFCSPIRWSIFFHTLLIFDIIVSYPINHYENIDLMITLGVPCLIAIELLLFINEDVYIDQYNYKMKLKYLSYHDQLTGVYNRNKIKELCILDTTNLIFNKACVLIMDIDFFKQVNDKYGHDVGDEVLKTIANIIESCVNTRKDYVIRWGGEEFVIFAIDYDLFDAKRLAENIRKKVEEYYNDSCNPTISIGIVQYDNKSYVDAIKNADKALYYAKEHGRNQVRIYKDGVIE